jgi:DNA-binding NtrC family response regulator
LKRKLLVVDDIPAVRDFIVDALDVNYEVTGVGSGSEALEALSGTTFDMVVTNIVLPDMDGEELMVTIKDRFPDVPVLGVTEYGSVETASRLMRLGAYDYIEKPFTTRRLKHTVNRAFEFATLMGENRALQIRLGEQDQMKNMIGNSVQMQHVREKIRLVARTNATILISGERGVGKEVAADEIHRLGDRAGRPFVKINCGSIPTSLLHSELFGDEQGSHAGAVEVQPGKFELASKGAILLDEIGEMDHAIQTKLFRVIEEGEFDRVGGTTPVKVDVRIVATTSRNLKEQIRNKRFREDLFYRLNVVPLEIPPLRDRREDIPLLISHFIEVFARENKTDPIRLTEAAIEKLCNAYWKGNVRQLQNVIERAAILRSGMTLDADFFHFEDDREEQLSRVEKAFRFGTIREMEKLMILNRLKDNQNNRTRSAETLEISVRTLRNKLNEYNVPKRHRTVTLDDLSTTPGRIDRTRRREEIDRTPSA